VDIAERTRAVLDLFDIDVVGLAHHILDEFAVVVVVVVDDGVNYLVGLGIDDVVVAVVVAFHVDASSSVHQYFHHSAEMH